MIRFTPLGYFSDSLDMHFWIPGSQFVQPGTYRFQLAVKRNAQPDFEIFPLGSKVYKETNDFNVLLVPVNLDGVIDEGRTWGDDLTANILPSMREMNRHLPVRDGVERFSYTPGSPPNAGIRYEFWPFAIQPAPGDTLDDLDPRARQLGNDLLHLINGGLERRDRSNTLGRLDRMCILGAATLSGGGQAQFGWSPCTSGAGFDNNPRGWSSSVVIQEFMHCLGRQVQADSPNNDGGAHSKNSYIPELGGRDVWNMLDRRTIRDTWNGMYYLVTYAPIQFLEGHEWNSIRRELVNKPRLPECCPDGTKEPGAKGLFTQVFRFVGEIDKSDVISETYTELRDADGLDLTPEDLSSPYEMVLLDINNIVTESLPFKVTFEVVGPHEVPPQQPASGKSSKRNTTIEDTIDNMGIIIQMPFADGSVKAEIRKGAQTLWSKSFSDQAPVLSNVQAVDDTKGAISLTWEVSDADTPDGDLRYCVFLKQDDNANPILLGHGLKGKLFSYPMSMAPAASQARLIVCATDGSNTDEAESNTFTIPFHPPVVEIVTPDPTDIIGPMFIQGVPITMRASAFDFTDGTLDGASVEWSSDKDGALGTGALLPAVQLNTPGSHTITVKATNSGGMMATDTVDITVDADTDGDGIPDNIEDMWPCLDKMTADSADDVDADGIPSYDEVLKYDTDPCEPDTDMDGVGDGDEITKDKDPTNAMDKPGPNELFIPGGIIDLGTCPMPSQAAVQVKTLDMGTSWTVATDSDWLSAVGGATGDGQFTVSADCSGLTGGMNKGMVVVKSSGGELRTIEVNVEVPLCLGDANGDSIISTADIDAIIDHILGITLLTGTKLEAADANSDFSVDVGDVIRLENAIDGSDPLPSCP